jgi:hypothetical protein
MFVKPDSVPIQEFPIFQQVLPIHSFTVVRAKWMIATSGAFDRSAQIASGGKPP